MGLDNLAVFTMFVFGWLSDSISHQSVARQIPLFFKLKQQYQARKDHDFPNDSLRFLLSATDGSKNLDPIATPLK